MFASIPYDRYRKESHQADILLWEPSGRSDLQGRMIAWATRGPYKHASLCFQEFGRLWQIGYHLDGNGQVSPLSAEVRHASGRIFVYRYRGPLRFDGARIAREAARSIGGDYQLRNIGLIAAATYLSGLGRLPAAGEWFRNAVRRQSRKTSGAICSQDVHRACRKGSGIILCPDRDEALVSPNDLARSPDLECLGRLVWPENWT